MHVIGEESVESDGDVFVLLRAIEVRFLFYIVEVCIALGNGGGIFIYSFLMSSRRCRHSLGVFVGDSVWYVEY